MISLLTIIALTSAAAVNALHSPRELSQTENRALAQFPKLTWKTLFDGTFMSEFETYAADQLMWRDQMIALRANSEYILGKKGNNGIHFAKNGYLIARPEAYDEKNVDRNIDSICALADTGLYNITVACVPTAFEVISHRLPSQSYDDRLVRVNERIEEGLAESDVTLCDVSTILNIHKNEYIYYKTDHHLTSLGSYYVYSAIGDSLGLEVYDEDEFERETVSKKFFGTSHSKAPIGFVRGDVVEKFVLPGSLDQTLSYPLEGVEKDTIYAEEFLDKKDKYSLFLGGNHALTVIDAHSNKGKKLAVIKDSYAHSIAPFLANHYDSVHLVDLRYYSEDLLQYLEDNEITEVLVLYNAQTFNTDTSLAKLGDYTMTSSIFDPPPFGFLNTTDPVEDGYFADAVIFGDSLAAGLSYNATIPAKFVCKASVNTQTIHTEKLGSRSVMNALLEQDASKYYISLGINEVSFRPVEEYKESYRAIIQAIREKNPASVIYIQSLMPIAKSVEERTNISKAKIDRYNEALVALAEEEKCYYLNVNGYLAEENGYLKEGVASDGIHFGAPYHARWENYLKNHALVDKRKGKSVEVINPYAGDGSINFDSFAREMLDCVLFKDTLTPVSPSAAARMFNLTQGEVVNGVVYTGGGGTAEEFAAFEAQTPEKALEIEQKLRERIEERKSDFENYIPQEMPKLNAPVVIVDGTLAAMCISDDNGAAEIVIGHY